MPPLLAVAVKVTLLPVQTEVPGFAIMVTPACNAELTTILIAVEETGEPETHDALLVIRQIMASPFTRVLEAYVELVALLIFVPFFFH